MTQQWASAHKATNASLSGTPLLTATMTTTDLVGSNVFATDVIAKKVYWEVVVTGTGIAAQGYGAGIGTTASSVTNQVFMGTSAAPDTLGWYGPPGTVHVNSSVIATWAAFVTGNRLCFAVDGPAALIWGRVANGNWNNNGSANPATGTLGLTIPSAVTASPMVPGATLYSTATPDSVVASFAQPSWTFTPPAGFESFDPAIVYLALNSPLLYRTEMIGY